MTTDRPIGTPANAPLPEDQETGTGWSSAALAPALQRGRPFLPGQSGNPSGRRPGTRVRITDVFLRTVVDDFAEHGAEAIAQVRRDDPGLYLRIIGALVPKELILQRERDPAVDIESLSLTEFIELIEKLKREKSLRHALLDAERQ